MSLVLEKVFSRKRNFALIAVSFCAFFYFALQLLVPLSLKNEVIEVEIPKGTSYKKTFDILEKNGLVRDKFIMLVLGRITGLDKRIKAGYYAFWDNEMPLSVLKTLIDGKVVEKTVTIIEGETIWNVAEKLQAEDIMSEETFFMLNADTAFLNTLDIHAPSLEGFLFPDTYSFPKGIGPEDVIRTMVNNLRGHFTPDMYEQMERINFTEREMLAMASIIEKEAVVDFERPVISAVYHNRLRKNMRLEADPTSIYGIKDFKYGVTRRDLRRKTPYNTYRRRGLPPGPIAAPGLKSIIAALYPANVPYLYFVSKDNREHYFSKTSREHFNAVRKFRLERRRNKKANSRG